MKAKVSDVDIFFRFFLKPYIISNLTLTGQVYDGFNTFVDEL